VDYEAETRAALAMTDLVEARSRTSEQLTALRKEAEKLHRRAGYLTTSEDTERRRLEWVKKELVAAGTERARSLGWTDVYTFAKAMGEVVVADLCHDMQVSIVRPAIVESSLKYPYPGWIEGFKMADPIILAYGRGQLPEFPASPDAVIDIIPCDYVVNTIVAVCATQPKVGEPEFYHCSSGARNPLTFRGIYEHIRSYFSRHPYRDGQGSHQLATWNFPGPEPVERKLWFAEKGVAIGNCLLGFAPRGKRTRAAARALDKTAKQLDFLNRYLGLYGEYLQSELHFVDDCTLALHNSLHEKDREVFGFDSGNLDWTHYLEDVHAPAITDPVRRLEAARRRRKARSATYRDLKPAKPGTVLAAFDLDGTVMTTNVIETYLWLKLPELSLTQRAGELMRVAAQLNADPSIQIHSAHSPLRELQILKDQLLVLLAQHPDWQPHDIAILTPHIEPYTPYIEAVFGKHSPHPLPYTLSDTQIAHHQPLLDALAQILALMDSRFEADKLIALLDNELILATHQLTRDDLPLIHDTIAQLNIRWGSDAAQRSQHSSQPNAQYTWQQGLERLVLGFMLPDNPANPIWHHIAPHSSNPSHQAPLSRFAALVATLIRHQNQWQAPATIPQWNERIHSLINDLITPQSDADHQAHQQLETALAQWQNEAQTARYAQTINQTIAIQHLNQYLTSQNDAGFLRGGITVCSMVPMRSLPFKVLCLLGLNDGDYPRNTKAAPYPNTFGTRSPQI